MCLATDCDTLRNTERVKPTVEVERGFWFPLQCWDDSKISIKYADECSRETVFMEVFRNIRNSE
jgi:hypothetical protein